MLNWYKDVYYDAVKFALIKDDWEILTEDYTLHGNRYKIGNRSTSQICL
ncbi:element excision factor XisH family protein [Scytonema sp. NUACC26]